MAFNTKNGLRQTGILNRVIFANNPDRFAFRIGEKVYYKANSYHTAILGSPLEKTIQGLGNYNNSYRCSDGSDYYEVNLLKELSPEESSKYLYKVGDKVSFRRSTPVSKIVSAIPRKTLAFDNAEITVITKDSKGNIYVAVRLYKPSLGNGPYHQDIFHVTLRDYMLKKTPKTMQK